MNKKILAVILVASISFCFIRVLRAEDQANRPQPPALIPNPGSCPCPGQVQTGDRKMPVIRAVDWVDAWQLAKEACANANSLTIQLIDRSGPSFQAIKVFECMELKSSGELLIIKVKRTEKQEEMVMIIRASDMLRIEITKRPFNQD